MLSDTLHNPTTDHSVHLPLVNCTSMEAWNCWNHWNLGRHALHEEGIKEKQMRSDDISSFVDIIIWLVDVPRCTKFWNTSGMVPLRLLPSRERYLNSSSSPNDIGIGPVRWLFCMSKYSRLLNHFISSGINPTRLRSAMEVMHNIGSRTKRVRVSIPRWDDLEHVQIRT